MHTNISSLPILVLVALGALISLPSKTYLQVPLTNTPTAFTESGRPKNLALEKTKKGANGTRNTRSTSLNISIPEDCGIAQALRCRTVGGCRVHQRWWQALKQRTKEGNAIGIPPWSSIPHNEQNSQYEQILTQDTTCWNDMMEDNATRPNNSNSFQHLQPPPSEAIEILTYPERANVFTNPVAHEDVLADAGAWRTFCHTQQATNNNTTTSSEHVGINRVPPPSHQRFTLLADTGVTRICLDNTKASSSSEPLIGDLTLGKHSTSESIPKVNIAINSPLGKTDLHIGA
jgi:hypothetical protein